MAFCPSVDDEVKALKKMHAGLQCSHAGHQPLHVPKGLPEAAARELVRPKYINMFYTR